LVTPPSPRSQSSDSGRYRRRRRRSSGSRRAGSSSSVRIDKDEGGEHDEGAVEEDADTDVTLASSIEDDLEGKIGSHPLDEPILSTTDEPLIRQGHQLATPASSVGSLEADMPFFNAKAKSKGGVISLLSTRSNYEDMTMTPSNAHSLSGARTSNVHTAAGVVLLSIAAAAVFWKVKPE